MKVARLSSGYQVAHRRKKKLSASELNDINTFRHATRFILKVAQGHWGTKHQQEYPTYDLAIAGAQQHDVRRCLIYGITPEGRFATIGHANFEFMSACLRQSTPTV